MKQYIQHIEQAMPQNLADISKNLKIVFLTVFIVLITVVSFRGEILPTGTLAMAPNPAGEETEQVDAFEQAMERALQHPSTLEPLPPQEIENEALWLARCIYSETKRAEEQELVAWAVRNRVETSYRGEGTYKSVVLDPYQFSAFNHGSRKRAHYMGLTASDNASGWQLALAIADRVIDAPAEARPFPITTRHYYSPRSMAGGGSPAWSNGKDTVRSDRDYGVDSNRFRFYAGVY